MALQINIQLNDKTGGVIAAGTYVKFGSNFQPDGETLNFSIFPYKSKSDYDAGKASYVPLEITNFSPTYIITPEDYTTLTPTVVHEKLKAILEAMPEIGVGNVTIVA